MNTDVLGSPSILHFLLAALLVGMPKNPEVLTILPKVEAQVMTPADWQVFASTTAQEAHINAEHLVAVIRCESNFIATSTGDFMNGDPTSFGIVQIHLPAHPDITKEQALDPYFAIPWMVHEWDKDREGEWSCYSIEKRRVWK